MKIAPVLLLVALAALANPVRASPAGPAVMVPEEGPDVPDALPVAVVTAFENEVYAGTAGVRAHSINVPSGWTRVVLSYEEKPLGDPWDRTFMVGIGGAQVLHGTTPRTDFTVRKDVTRYASLLPQGGTAVVDVNADSWVGAQSITIKLEFYDDPSNLAVEAPATAVLSPTHYNGYCGGSSYTKTLTFPATAPKSARVELFASGHGEEEDYFLHNPTRVREFRVLVDGHEIANAVMMPYTYAFLGFYGSTGELLHPLQWWTAQQVADVAGVHTGVGEIPPYRALVNLDDLALLTGTHDVTVKMDPLPSGSCIWFSSVNFLVNE